MYWALGNPSTGAIRKASVALSSPVTLAANQARPRGVAIDATYVYWTNFDDRTVRRILR